MSDHEALNGVIYADPCWRYRNFSDAAHGAAAAHYATLPDDDIASLPVRRWSAPDCVLALWTTWPKLAAGVEVVRAWGFDYVTGFPWVKVTPSTGEIRRGVGFWTMAASEVLLLGKRGEPARRNLDGGRGKPIGLMAGEEQRIFWAPIGRHSAKPLEVHAWLESTLDGPYLELFARRTRPGWTCWGLEVGTRLTADGVETADLPVDGSAVTQDERQGLLWGEPVGGEA